MKHTPPDVTALLREASAGNLAAFDQLYTLVYDELRRMARSVRNQRVSTINTTALVHEAYIKLAGGRIPEWKNRLHFFRIAARAMRQVLITAVEKRMTAKRGGGQFTVQFDEALHSTQVQPEALLALEETLKQLETVDPRQARIVECRFFAGLSIEETGAALGISESSVKRDWRTARAWLGQALKSDPEV